MAQQLNLTLDAGVDFFARISCFDVNSNPADLTDYTAVSQMRAGYGGALVASFVATPNGTLGTIDLFMDSIDTSTIAAGVSV